MVTSICTPFSNGNDLSLANITSLAIQEPHLKKHELLSSLGKICFQELFKKILQSVLQDGCFFSSLFLWSHHGHYPYFFQFQVDQFKVNNYFHQTIDCNCPLFCNYLLPHLYLPVDKKDISFNTKRLLVSFRRFLG